MNPKIALQHGKCALCGEKFTDYTDVVPDHICPRGMGGAWRDDHPDNIQAVQIHDHVFGLRRLALAAAGSLLQSVRFAPAVLDARLHHAKEVPDPVGLLTMSFAELLKPIHQFGSRLAANLGLLFYLIEKHIKLAINLEQGMLLCYGWHDCLRISSNLVKTWRSHTLVDPLSPLHHQAAGLTIPLAHVETFEREFAVYAASLDLPRDRPIHADTELVLATAGKQFDEQLAQLEPFGEGNPAPVFLLRQVEIGSVKGRWVRIRQGRYSLKALCCDLSSKVGMRGDCLIESRGKRRILRDFRPADAVV